MICTASTNALVIAGKLCTAAAAYIIAHAKARLDTKCMLDFSECLRVQERVVGVAGQVPVIVALRVLPPLVDGRVWWHAAAAFWRRRQANHEIPVVPVFQMRVLKRKSSRGPGGNAVPLGYVATTQPSSTRHASWFLYHYCETLSPSTRSSTTKSGSAAARTKKIIPHYRRARA